jgi:hypothetical protein
MILFGLITILGSPSDAKSKASDTVKWMRTVTLIPYIFTVEHSRLLCAEEARIMRMFVQPAMMRRGIQS